MFSWVLGFPKPRGPRSPVSLPCLGHGEGDAVARQTLALSVRRASRWTDGSSCLGGVPRVGGSCVVQVAQPAVTKECDPWRYSGCPGHIHSRKGRCHTTPTCDSWNIWNQEIQRIWSSWVCFLSIQRILEDIGRRSLKKIDVSFGREWTSPPKNLAVQVCLLAMINKYQTSTSVCSCPRSPPVTLTA